MRRYVQLSLQTEIKRATHHTIYNGMEFSKDPDREVLQIVRIYLTKFI
ncbi:MAG: hypothetical protein HC789_17500 [Microcoleus sp. CSU_2_2]|nr:hypothetical protein [Microcoleus sp. SU_5_3]NJS12038.1 hypothetical protein [Microcoleus sp. CSU_2_2]